MARQVNVKIEIEGGRSIERHLGLVIEQELFDHHRFELQVPFDQLEDRNEHFFNQAHREVLGKKITFSFSPRLTRETFHFSFQGIITEIRLQTLSDLNSAFVLKGFSPTIVLEDAVQRRSFLDHSVQDIFSQVLGRYPQNLLRKQLNPQNGGRREVFVQYNESNYAFLSRVADRCSEWFYYNGRELMLGHGNEAGEVDFLVDGRQNFNMAMVLQPSVFSMSRYNYFRHQTFASTSSSQRVDGLTSFSEFALQESDHLFAQAAQLRIPEAVRDQREADEITKMEKAARVSSMVDFQGSGEVPVISVGTILAVKGNRINARGERYEERFGKYRVTSIRHEVNVAGSYRNHFHAVPESVQHPPRNPEVKQPLGQTEVAEVIDNDDPDKLGRVKVRFYWGQSRPADQESLWLRVACLHTAQGKGSFFIPEIGSQVMVSYEGNLAELPFILTGLYPKSNDGTSYTTDNNGLKVITTREGTSVVFVDEQDNPRLSFRNLNKNETYINLHFGNKKLSLKAKDGTIEMQTGTLSIAASDIRMKADNKFELEAGEIKMTTKRDGLELESIKDVKVKATMAIEMEATTELKAKGTVSATLEGAQTKVSGQGMVEVQAALVKIN
ncbi:type VI secretion system Vgr family protein [Larkinella soli]|uniref:type VI secretion system Vgr family protein n=1 Tax=Larkinella soli TaxID=1770527 RepID=UPI000FFB6A1E|nr:phage baseplate assembly protein V [Larkinella soli]